jgi:hypothetical protein
LRHKSTQAALTSLLGVLRRTIPVPNTAFVSLLDITHPPTPVAKKGEKNDDSQGYLGTWNSGSDPKVMPRSKQRRASLNSVLFCVGRVVVVLFATILQGRLGMLHGTKIKSSAMAKIRAATKKRATKPPVGKDVYGGMAKLRDSSSVGGRFRGSVSGGMAHHSEVDFEFRAYET